jgi:hypothetical protein
MVDWAVANGFACVDCGYGRCRCPSDAEIDAMLEAEARFENRTARLMRAIDAAEARVEFLYSLTEKHPGIPEAMERFENLSRALLNHRRAHSMEKFA